MSESNLRRQIGFYEKKAGRFDRSITSLGSRENRNHRKKIRTIAESLGLLDRDAPSDVLEVGTGTGLHASWLLEHSSVTYWGVDASPEMLRLAQVRLSRRDGRVHLGIGDAERLPFPDASFPAAFCSGTLHHLARPGAGVAELVRVVAPGGRVAVMEPNWKFPAVLLASALLRVERNAFKISPRRLEEWGHAAGLEDLVVSPLLYTPPRPAALGAFYDRVDSAIPSVPLARGLSIMLLMSGRRTG